MKMAVLGCGALGGFYGARLCRAGEEVHCLLRSDYEVVRQRGLRVVSVDGDFEVRPHCARTPEEIGPADVVLIGLKTTANAALAQLLPPVVGPQTMVVSLQNGLGDEELLAGLVGAERVLGGLCFVCLNRVEPGVIQHTAHGLVVLGEHLRPPQPRTQALAARFRGAGISCRVAEDLARAHWEKLVWNVPFNGLGVAGVAGYEAVRTGAMLSRQHLGPTLATDALLGDARWATLARELMLEVIEAAHALGFPLDRALAEQQIERTRVMGAYKASTLIDWEERRPLEIASMFEEPLRRARRVGVAAPRLQALCTILRHLELSRANENRADPEPA